MEEQASPVWLLGMLESAGQSQGEVSRAGPSRCWVVGKGPGPPVALCLLVPCGLLQHRPLGPPKHTAHPHGQAPLACESEAHMELVGQPRARRGHLSAHDNLQGIT